MRTMFNINYEVKVKLTSRGLQILREQDIEFFKKNPHLVETLKDYTPSKRKPDENGWCTWQLWDLMNTFGDHIYNGCQPPFELEIEILPKGLEYKE